MRESKAQRYKEVGSGQLRAFCECANRKSFAGAARALDRSHPTVWEQVRSLERRLGVSLLQRDGRYWRLTEDGQVLLDLAAPIVDAMDTLEETFAQRCRGLPRSLTFVGTYTVIVEDLAWPIADFCQGHPEIKVTILNYIKTTILDSLTSGDVDLAILPLDLVSVAHRHLTLEPLYCRPASLVTPEGHPLAKKRRVTPADIAEYPLILPAEADSSWRNGISEVFERAGLLDRLRVSLEIGFIQASRRYVGRGLGIALMPLPLNAMEYPGVVIRPLDEPFPSEQVSILWRRGAKPRPQARLFADFVRGRVEAQLKKKTRGRRASPSRTRG
jgi:DNA-binding transcriptional LysR family regulator